MKTADTKLEIGCITMGLGGYPTTAEYPNFIEIIKRDPDGKPSESKGIPEANALASVIKKMTNIDCIREDKSTTTTQNVEKVKQVVGEQQAKNPDQKQVFILSGAKTGSGRQADIFANNLDLTPPAEIYALPMRRSKKHLKKLPFIQLAYHYLNGIKEVFGSYICQIKNCGAPNPNYTSIGLKPMTPEFKKLLEEAAEQARCFAKFAPTNLADTLSNKSPLSTITDVSKEILYSLDVNLLGSIVEAPRKNIERTIPKPFADRDEKVSVGDVEFLNTLKVPATPEEVLVPILGQ